MYGVINLNNHQQAVILANDVYVGSGALIDNFHVITAAHRVNDYL